MADVPAPLARAPRALREFLETEAGGGIALVVAAGFALAWANSPWHGAYESLWHTSVQVGAGRAEITQDLRHWVNDGLMAVFFLVVGFEVKREVVLGDLRLWRTAALPVVAAGGGMVVPALVFLAFNAGGPGSDGWGVPMATDIAFAVGVLAVVGRNAHSSLRIFLLTLAVADDVGAIVVIALVYASSVDLWWLSGAAGLLLAMVALHRLRVRHLGVFAVLALGVWVCTFRSGVHATIAGVAIGLLTPARPSGGQRESTVERLEGMLHPWTSFVIVPLFALANSGVRVADLDFGAPGATAVAAGTAVALVAGKLVGIMGASALAVRAGVGRLPDGLTWRELAGGAACAGIGFTVSLFIAGLAFDDVVLADAAKAGILAGSLVAALVAAAILETHRTRPAPR